MLPDDPLWQIRQAKTSLFGALLNRSQLPPAHVLSVPPLQRDVTRSNTNDLISSLLEVEHELRAIQQEVQRACDSVFGERAAAEMSLCPVGVLPPEVIREIVSHTIAGTHAPPRHFSPLPRFEIVARGGDRVFCAIHRGQLGQLARLVIGDLVFACRFSFVKVHLGNSARDQPPIHALLRKVSIQVGKLKVVVLLYSREWDMFELHLPSLQY